MAFPHLSRMVPWDTLVEVMRKPDPSQILLPCGPCDRVHVRDDEDRSTARLVSARKFITEEMVCHDANCPTTNKKAVAKRGPSAPELGPCNRIRTPDNVRRIQGFVAKFNEAVVEFAETESKKYSPRVMAAFKKHPPAEEVAQEVLSKFYGVAVTSTATHSYEHELFWALLAGENGDEDVKRLLYWAESGRVDVRAALATQYGGQAVGNGASFLLWHLFRFYITANLVIACGYQSSPEKWGLLSPSSRGKFLAFIQNDCDFLLLYLPGATHWRRVSSWWIFR